MKNTIMHEITPHELITMCEKIYSSGGRIQMAYAWYPPKKITPEIIYVASVGNDHLFHAWRCQLTADKKILSLANAVPLLGWYEREMSDLFGITFSDHPENVKLVLHEGAELTTPPMDPHYSREKIISFSREPWQLPEMENSELQLLPFGPIRADVCESAEFQYLYAGESILHFDERLFFKHRGMEKKFESLTPQLGVILAERVSGVGSVTHALAFSQAVEAACNCTVPQLAKQWRIILSELERLYNHVHYLAHLCHTTTLKVGEAQGKILEEKLKQLNAKITGSRFLREIITPGGLRCEPNSLSIKKEFKKLQEVIIRYCEQIASTNSHIDRLIGTGLLTQQVAFDEGATGPVSRASGIQIDFRVAHSYASYDQINFAIPILATGDALARMTIRIAEIHESFCIINETVAALEKDSIYTAVESVPFAEGLGWAESPRGGLLYAVHFDQDGTLLRVKIKSPSFSNWRVFPFTVDETNMMDYAINEASFGSTVAGCDR